jgi:beta-galactosidase
VNINFKFGVDYYPEHWPQDRQETDIVLMKKMGLQVVRLAEFSWHKMEPSEGVFDFDWLEQVLPLLDKYDIKVVLGTPTAAPPAWLVEKHPDILPVDSRGRVRGFGGRHHDCQSNPVYRDYVYKIVTAMTERFGTDPRIAGWQTDNEFGNSHEDFCHCSHCRNAFQSWLRDKYCSVDKLNETWGTYFWSQTYDHFEQIPTPKLSPNSHNPSLLLDWKRFRSDLIVDFQKIHTDIIRKNSPGKFITHNFMSFFNVADYFDLARDLDFVSHDQYITGYWIDPEGMSPAELGAVLDHTAGFKNKPFWVMEQQAGQTGWETMGRTPKKGQLALWAFQSIAHGADTVVFFRWRTCTVGTEQYWHGILPHNGVPGRRYDELAAFIKEISPFMPDFEGALNGAEAAILHSYEQNWALEIQPHNSDLDYMEISTDFYEALHERNIPVSFIPSDADFSAFKLIIAPLMFLDLSGVAEKLDMYVKEGGHVVLTPRTGVKTYNNTVQTGAPLPGPYKEMLGLEILDYDCLRDALVDIGSKDGKGKYWWDEITAVSADVYLPAEGKEHTGEPSIAKNRYGNGLAWYMATFPDKELLRRMTGMWIDEAGLTPLDTTPEGVELVRRRATDSDYLFVLNHTENNQKYRPDGSWENLIGSYKLPPFGFALYKSIDC